MNSNNNAGILKEADSNFKKGNSELKTGVFKWSKDYNSAVTYFDEAVTLYRKAEAYDKAILALKQARVCNEKLSDVWATARNLEAIVNIMIDNINSKDTEQFLSIMNEASAFFKADNHYTECIKLKHKLAKHLATFGDNDAAIKQLLESALEDADESDKQYNKKDVFDFQLEYLIGRGEYSSAISAIKKQLTPPGEKKGRYNTEASCLTIVVLCLLLDEPIRAEEEMKTLPVNEFYTSRDYEVATALVEAYAEGNQEQFNANSSRACVTNLYPPSIPRLLRKKVLKGGLKKNKAADDLFGNSGNNTNEKSLTAEEENDLAVL